MSGCLLAGALVLTLAGDGFALDWTHSVEKIAWHEEWQVRDGALVLTGAAVKGSGAGMEPGPGAVLRDGWWVWSPDLPPQRQLTLAASGATGGGWRICDAGPPDAPDRACTELGSVAGEAITLTPCPADRADGGAAPRPGRRPVLTPGISARFRAPPRPAGSARP